MEVLFDTYGLIIIIKRQEIDNLVVKIHVIDWQVNKKERNVVNYLTPLYRFCHSNDLRYLLIQFNEFSQFFFFCILLTDC